jgi:protein gp37
MGDTSIQWTDKTWSPIRARVKKDAPQIAILHGWKELAEICEKMIGHVGPHCEFVSLGCHHCYSCTNNHRRLPSNGTGLPFDKRSRELVDILVDEKMLIEPLKWRKPVKVFVENQSDLFGEWVPFEFIDKVFAVMALTPRHTYQILTKRPERMREYMADLSTTRCMGRGGALLELSMPPRKGVYVENFKWPLPNVWLGVSVENQPTADERLPILLQTPAAVRFVSYEPALAAVDFTAIRHGNDLDLPAIEIGLLHWLIVGGESGNGARPFNLQWARDVVAQCKAAGVACFVKQLGTYVQWDGIQGGYGDGPGNVWPNKNHKEHDNGCWRVFLDDPKGGWMEEWPADLRVREFPNVRVSA